MIQKEAFYKMTYGLFIVTVVNGKKMGGCVLNTALQLTSLPFRMSFTINKENFTTSMIEKSGECAINVISLSAETAFIGRFGYNSSKDMNKFEGLDYEIHKETKLPYFKKGVNSVFILKVIDKIDVGTHYTFICDVVDAVLNNNEPSMSYDFYRTVRKGVTPKKASSYIPEDDKKNKASKLESKPIDKSHEERKIYYQCDVCGFQYDKESFDDDYKCPLCGQLAKDHFKKV